MVIVANIVLNVKIIQHVNLFLIKLNKLIKFLIFYNLKNKNEFYRSRYTKSVNVNQFVIMVRNANMINARTIVKMTEYVKKMLQQ
jgi:hypothetical protein